jgi:putative FmdB family regulatory protein
MPLHEYECEACGHRFEQIQKFSDPPLSACPICTGTLRKLISSPAIQFKGSGWYITDYARKSGTAAPSNGNGAHTKTPTAQAGNKHGDKKANTPPKTGSSGSSSSSSSE